MKHLLFDISCLEPLPDQFPSRNWTDGLLEIVVRDFVECTPDIGVEDPLLGLIRSSQAEDFLDGVMTASTWSKPIADSLKLGLPGGFESVFHHGLNTAIHHNRNPKRPAFSACFRYVYSSYWFGFPKVVAGECIDHLSSGCWCFNDQLIHSRRVFPSVD